MIKIQVYVKRKLRVQKDNEYGVGKFEQVYNQAGLEEVLKKVYGKNLEELEKEWFHYIYTDVKEINMEEKMKSRFFYYLQAGLKDLKPGEFKE
ncbi:hypothetical protein [Bacillus sp. CBEL-1]|uniref:hypothetical protein n=1 Tax=Bacillus sp. CBEL-1 TaxID=2502980 RepID=UPI001047997D|nr:hypothetical protein [Bacillus sp. CBEL-1]TDB55039.1 hypothetical protein EPL02_02245 [Bacillus sp. CBEL-1]